METEEEWGALSLDPRQPLLAQKVPAHPSIISHPSIIRLLHVSSGDGWSAGVPAVAQGAELVFLQAADEPRPFSILLPLLFVLLTCAGLHVPLQLPLVGCNDVTRAFSLLTSDLEPVSLEKTRTFAGTVEPQSKTKGSRRTTLEGFWIGPAGSWKPGAEDQSGSVFELLARMLKLIFLSSSSSDVRADLLS